MSSLFFWFVYFTLDYVYKVKAVFITIAVLTIALWGFDINALINVLFHLGLLKVSRGEELTIIQKDLGSGWTSVRNSEEQVIIP